MSHIRAPTTLTHLRGQHALLWCVPPLARACVALRLRAGSTLGCVPLALLCVLRCTFANLLLVPLGAPRLLHIHAVAPCCFHQLQHWSDQHLNATAPTDAGAFYKPHGSHCHHKSDGGLTKLSGRQHRVVSNTISTSPHRE